jgi:hypothetical protein
VYVIQTSACNWTGAAHSGALAKRSGKFGSTELVTSWKSIVNLLRAHSETSSTRGYDEIIIIIIIIFPFLVLASNITL